MNKRLKKRKFSATTNNNRRIDVLPIAKPKYKMATNSTIHLIFSVIFMLIGIVSENGPVAGKASAEVIPSIIPVQNIVLSKKVTETQEIPLKLIIPSIKINLKVEKGQIKDGTWDLNDYSALYAEGSSSISTQYGNAIIYAHARRGLFGQLKDVNIGDYVTVIGSENVYVYQVTSKESIFPDDLDKIKEVGKHQLTLFTCDGASDQYRLLVRAKKVEIKNGPSEII